MAGEIQLNSVSLATESGGTVTLNSSTDIKGCLNASGSAPIYACRAWINFDGTSASIGTGRANGNVSGVTDNGTGNSTITFATAMPDANYAALNKSEVSDAAGGSATYNSEFYSIGSGSISVKTYSTSAEQDHQFVFVAIFR
jgi:hypothetical protein